MNINDVEIDILNKFKNILPSFRNTQNNVRVNYIAKLYNFLQDILGESLNKEYSLEKEAVITQYFRKTDGIVLSDEIIYSLHIQIINRIFNSYIFNKYNIHDNFNILFEDMCPYYNSKGVVNFMLKDIPHDIAYRDSRYTSYDIGIEKNIMLLTHDRDIKEIFNKEYKDYINLSTEEFTSIKSKYDSFIEKSNELISNINKELKGLQKYYIFLSL